MSRSHNETGCRACRRGSCWKQLRKAELNKRAKAATPSNDNYAEAYEEYAWLAVPNRFALAPTRLDYAPDAEEIANERYHLARFFSENDHEWTELAELRVPVLRRVS